MTSLYLKYVVLYFIAPCEIAVWLHQNKNQYFRQSIIFDIVSPGNRANGMYIRRGDFRDMDKSSTEDKTGTLPLSAQLTIKYRFIP